MEFDSPIFKVLAHNDTGAAAGHQGGFVLPKALEDYLPLLRNSTSPSRPTVDVAITADLFHGPEFLETVNTRYQYQTWGGERSPERRITGGISKLRNLASKDDILIIERGIENDAHYRFTLITSDLPEYQQIRSRLGTERWGVLHQGMPPISEIEVESSVSDLAKLVAEPFSMFDPKADHSETRTRRIARGRAFKRLVRQHYHDECAICRNGFQHPDGRSELEAGHIVSRAKKGADDVRNGILFCRSHHWAFDAGLMGINDKYELIVSEAAKQIPQNDGLKEFDGVSIRLPNEQSYLPNLAALAWHRKNVMI